MYSLYNRETKKKLKEQEENRQKEVNSDSNKKQG